MTREHAHVLSWSILTAPVFRRTRNIGRVTLLGDSAHAMVPFQTQGAAQAIGDAAVLDNALAGATSPEVPDALDRYASRRLSTATRRAGQLHAQARTTTCRRGLRPRRGTPAWRHVRPSDRSHR